MKPRRYIVLTLVALLFLCSSIGASAESASELPANLEAIEEEAFMGSSSLESVILPDGIKYIGDRAFADSSLKQIYMPGSLRTIAENAFDHHSPALIIKGETGTLAETYAKSHDILFAAVNGEPKYESTKKFLDAIATEEGVTYMIFDTVYEGDKDYEEVIVTLQSDSLISGEGVAGVYFSEDGTEVLAAAPVIYYDPNDLADILVAVNDWNAYSYGCTGVRFYADTSDNSVMARLDLFTTMDSLAEVAPYAVGVLIGYIDAVADDLAIYAV
jgi:hypothetical protein